MKHTLTILLLVLLLCAPGMAQTKAKPILPTSGSTGTSTVLHSATAGDSFSFKSSTGTLVFVGEAAPITIDGETTDCTREHLVKALKIAAAMIADPNEAKCFDCFSSGLYVYADLSRSQKPADEKRAQAERLKAEADRLEAESKRVQWVRAVLAECDK